MLTMKEMLSFLGEVICQKRYNPSMQTISNLSFWEFGFAFQYLLQTALLLTLSQGFFFMLMSDNEVYLVSTFWQLGQWSTFGSLDLELETQPFSVVTEEECEILKISAKEYEKLKMVRPHITYILIQHKWKFSLSSSCLENNVHIGFRI